MFRPFIKLKNDAGSEDVYYSFVYDAVPSEFKTMLQRELNETEENKRKGVEKLREYLNREGILQVDENTLVMILRSCKYNIKKSETKLKKFLMIRNMLIEKLKQMDEKKFEYIMEDNVVGFLPYRDKHGRTIFYTAPNLNFNLYDAEEATLCGMCLAFFSLTFPLSTVAGMCYIGDCKTPRPSVHYALMRSLRNAFLTIVGYPMRIARVEVINEMFVMRCFYNILRPLLPYKITQRVSFYGSDLKVLQNHYHPDILPEEFGGRMGPISPKLYKEDFLHFVRKLKSESINRNIKV